MPERSRYWRAGSRDCARSVCLQPLEQCVQMVETYCISHARFVSIGAAGQCAHRANINAHPALFAFQVIFAVGMIIECAPRMPTPAPSHPCLHRKHARSGSTGCSAAHRNKPGPTTFPLAVNLFFHEPAGIRAVAEHPCPAIRTRRLCRRPGNPAGGCSAGIPA